MKPSSRIERQVTYLLLSVTLLLSFVAALIFAPQAAAATVLAEGPDVVSSLLDGEPEEGHIIFAGVIVALPAEGTVGTWTVDGQAVNVSAETHIQVHGEATIAVGNWAVVHARKNNDGTMDARHIHVTLPIVHLEGPINGIPEGRIGPWIIAGQTVMVTAETRIGERAGPAVMGAWVSVFAQQDETGVLVASHIIVVGNGGDRIKLHGAIQEIGDTSWVISGIQVMVDANTIIEGPAQVGLLAKVSAELPEGLALSAIRAADEPLLARHIRVDWRERNGPKRIAVRGIVQSLPEGGLIGDWVVEANGTLHTIHVTESTYIVQTKGQVEVGSAVVVTGLLQADGSINATYIVVLPNEQRIIRFEGTIESLPEGGLVGTWIISGRAVTVTEQTRIDESDGPAEVGAQVECIAWVKNDGSLVALKIEVKDEDDDDPPGHFVRFVGPIVQLPEGGGYIGIWIVGVQQVQVTAETEIETEHGPIQVGAWVEVRGVQTAGLTDPAAGIVVAHKIKVLRHDDDDDEDLPEVEFEGLIEARPPARNGLWRIAGRQVMVNAHTEIDEANGPAVVGAFVEVEGWEVPGSGQVIAKKIEVED